MAWHLKGSQNIKLSLFNIKLCYICSSIINDSRSQINNKKQNIVTMLIFHRNLKISLFSILNDKPKKYTHVKKIL